MGTENLGRPDLRTAKLGYIPNFGLDGVRICVWISADI